MEVLQLIIYLQVMAHVSITGWFKLSMSYLHEAIEPKVVHRDIKSSNILIDDEFNANVSDFGLAKLLGSGKSHITTRICDAVAVPGLLNATLVIPYFHLNSVWRDSSLQIFADISLKDIDQLANDSFPLCMRHLFNKVISVYACVTYRCNSGYAQLREDRHLKHGGWMQLGLFLMKQRHQRRSLEEASKEITGSIPGA